MGKFTVSIFAGIRLFAGFALRRLRAVRRAGGVAVRNVRFENVLFFTAFFGARVGEMTVCAFRRFSTVSRTGGVAVRNVIYKAVRFFSSRLFTGIGLFAPDALSSFRAVVQARCVVVIDVI